MDYLILRKRAAAPGDPPPRTLLRLWALLPRVAVVEYKSPGRPYRTGDLDRLWSYVHAYRADPGTRPETRADLCGVLVVPGRTPSLDEDAEEMGLAWEDLGGGYWRAQRGLFALYVVEIDVVGPAEGDPVLHSLGNGKIVAPEVRRFWMEMLGSKEAGMSMQDLEGYDELMGKLIEALPPEQRLAGLPPEQRLAGLPPEQWLAGQDRDHQALALPLEVLRLLPDSYIRSLSPEVQDELRRRIRGTGD